MPSAVPQPVAAQLTGAAIFLVMTARAWEVDTARFIWKLADGTPPLGPMPHAVTPFAILREGNQAQGLRYRDNVSCALLTLACLRMITRKLIIMEA